MLGPKSSCHEKGPCGAKRGATFAATRERHFRILLNSDYSVLSDTIGSILAARLAGTKQAANATMVNVAPARPFLAN